jgi:transcriptional regulator with XRE-family HTH domain
MQEQNYRKGKPMKPIFAANMAAYSDAWRGRGVSYADQAKRCNLSKGQFSEMRSGKVHSPGVWTALRIAEGLGVTVDDLLTDRPSVREKVCQSIFSGNNRPVCDAYALGAKITQNDEAGQ